MLRLPALLVLLSLASLARAEEGSLVLVQPAGKEPVLRIGGLLQAQAEFGDRLDSRWDNANDRIYLRRARINFQGKFLEEFEFRFEADAAGSLSSSVGLRLQLTDGYVDWRRYRAAYVRVGQFKTPFGYEQLVSDPRLLAPERSFATDRLTLSRQLGAGVGGEFLDGRFSYAAGLFNGSGANNSGNDSDQFTYVARVAGILQRSDASQLSVGGNAYSSHDRTVVLGADFGFDSTPETPAADNVFRGERAGTGLDLQWRIGRFELWLEALRAEFEPDNSIPAGSFESSGGYAQLSYFVIPARLQALIRYEVFDPSDAVGDDDTATASAGLNLLFKGDDLKLQAHYLRADVPGADQDEGKAILRMQVVF